VESIAVSVLDVLGAFETIKVCTRYRLDGMETDTFPASADVLDQVEPLYEELEGWCCDISGAQSWDELPAQARRYLEMMEQVAGAPVEFISIGPDREQLIRRQGNG